MTITCYHIGQKSSCKFAIQFNNFPVPVFKTGVFPICACLPRLPISLGALQHPSPIPCDSLCCEAVPDMSLVLILLLTFPSVALGPGCGYSSVATDPSGRQADDGVTVSDRDDLTLSWGVIQTLATAPQDAALILVRSKH